MRLSSLCLLAILPFLAACDSSAPKAPAADAGTKVAAATEVTPAQTPPKTAVSVPARFPISARPMLGTWAADASGCADAKQTTVVTATSYVVGGRSCDIALADNKDGTFSTTCGQQNLKMTPIFGPTGEGIRIAVGDAKPANVFRCSK